jgi:hypothetical protein
LERAKKLVGRKTQPEWTLAPKIHRIAKNMESGMPRATFGGSEMVNGKCVRTEMTDAFKTG